MRFFNVFSLFQNSIFQFVQTYICSKAMTQNISLNLIDFFLENPINWEYVLNNADKKVPRMFF